MKLTGLHLSKLVTGLEDLCNHVVQEAYKDKSAHDLYD